MVIGAGMAGLLAATVLAECYDQVTVVDRDLLPADSRARRGVPQGRHVHALLANGLRACEQLLPGIATDLKAGGAVSGDVLGDGRGYFNGCRLTQTHSDLPALGVTRPHLELHVRNRVRAHDNIRFLTQRTVAGLIAAPGGRGVAGVRLMPSSRGDPDQAVEADLVVDASGRHSSMPRWLVDLGYDPPREERVAIDIGYTSWFVRAPDDLLAGDLGVAVGATPAVPRGGALVRVEGERWLVSLAGYQGNHPPAGLDECLAFAARMVVPDIYQALATSPPLSEPARFSVRHAVRRHYERLARFPDGLVVLGDAACVFNPIYGQGMTVAATQALALRQFLRSVRPVTQLREAIAQASGTAWRLSVMSDRRMPWIGTGRISERVSNRYATMIFHAAQRDPRVARAFIRVANLVQPPQSLVHPMIAARILARGALASPIRPRTVSTALAAPPEHRRSTRPDSRPPGDM